MTLAMIINIIVAILLVITIIYAIILNHNLKKVRDARGELQGITQKFVEASAKANSSIESLKKAANKMEVEIRQQIGRGEEIKSDLAFFIKKGDDIAARLEENILAKKEAPPAHSPQPMHRETRPQEEMTLRSPIPDDAFAETVKDAGHHSESPQGPQRKNAQNNIKSAILKAIQDINN